MSLDELTIAVADSREPSSAATWSGTTFGLAQALRGLGVTVEALHAAPPAALERNAIRALAAARALPRVRPRDLRSPRRLVQEQRADVVSGPLLAGMRTLSLRLRARRLPRLDAIVALGTSFSLPPGPRGATYDDMTVKQAMELYPEWQALPRRALETWVERQRRAYERAHACCFMSRWAAESALADYGVPEEKVHVIGAGRNRSPARPERDWTRPRFLWVGLDWERKNGEAVLAAFAEVRRRLPEATLDMVGAHPELSADGVTGHGVLRLDVPEERSRLDAIFESATCLVMPSWREPLGFVYAEAAAAGIPSIGTRIGGAGEVIGPGGRVVDPADREELTRAMLELADPATAQRLGALAAEQAEIWSWRATAERLLRALGFADRAERPLAPLL